MNSPFTTMTVITVTAMGIFSAFPVFWYLPPTFLTGTGAAGGIAVVNSIAAVSGLVAPYVTGWLVDLTGSARLGLWVVGTVAVAGALGLLAMSRWIPTQSPAQGGAR
jgi:hypothetical protein